jgi:cytidylate kinase
MRNIAIDGPAGAGKSTIAKQVAKRLNYIYVDTGAMYRSMALACLRAGVDIQNEEAVAKICEDLNVAIRHENGEQVVLLNGENVNGFIRTQEVGNATSVIAVYPQVREKLVGLQRQLANEENVVMDGRDIGSAVLPNADVKIYLTASARVRAERRCKELLERGEAADVAVVEQDIVDRDWRDMHREISPLVQVEDAVLVDASDMTIEMVTNRILEIINAG